MNMEFPSDEQFRLQCGEMNWQDLANAKAGYRMAMSRSAWQPISKCSPDVRSVLLFGFPLGFRCIWIGNPNGFDRDAATHWMPLPEPPK